ncbi:MAG: LacI family DNA-binding transcriptional regulator [Pseudomonadota bacterium]
MNVTIRDIAKAAGLSSGTISRALKNEGGLTEETRRTVLDLAHSMGYDLGRLRQKKLRRLTFLLHRQHDNTSSSPFYTPVLHGAAEACRKHGIILSFTAVGPVEGVLDQIRLHQSDAILCAGYFEPELLEALRSIGKPLALIDMKLAGYTSANPDNMMGGYLAARHLLDIGRERIGFISGSLAHFSIRERARGLRQALYNAGVLADPRLEVMLQEGDELEHAAREAMETLLALPQPPDAVFCYNDAAALVAMETCQRAGLKVPFDISIVGFDDIAAAAQARTPLTTLSIDKSALGALGVELLLNGQAGEVCERVLPVSLIVRESTKPT